MSDVLPGPTTVRSRDISSLFFGDIFRIVDAHLWVSVACRIVNSGFSRRLEFPNSFHGIILFVR